MTSLSLLLGLKPLDRVQLNNAKEIKEFRISAYKGEPADLPFLYFQRVLTNGLIELRTPGGYVTSVAPTDICDFLPGSPVIVRAMPRSVFIERLKISASERLNPAPPECYSDAYVMHASKDKWGFVEVVVLFKDSALNNDSFIAPVHPDDKQLLQKLAKRTIMPVYKYRSGANYSADHGLSQNKEYARMVVKATFRSAAIGIVDNVELLTAIADKKISRAKLVSYNGGRPA